VETTVDVILVDDEIYLCEHVKQVLEPYGIKTIAIAGEGGELLGQLKYLKPDVILLDLEMPGMNGLETFIHLKDNYPQLKVIVLSVHKNPTVVRNYLNGSACAYFSKDIISRPEEMAKAIREVKNKGMSSMPLPRSDINFSEREIEVMLLMARDKTSREIAGKLCISERTVEKHRLAVYGKTNIKTSSGLGAYIVEHRLHLIIPRNK
jgi:DNA-binding NarL/FixJ family response regulator